MEHSSITSTVIPITTLWPWNSLCSTRGGRSISTISRNSHLGFIGGELLLTSSFQLSFKGWNKLPPSRDPHDRKGQQASSQHNWERGRKPGQAARQDKTTDKGEKQANPRKTTGGRTAKAWAPPTFPVVHDDDDDDDDDHYYYADDGVAAADDDDGDDDGGDDDDDGDDDDKDEEEDDEEDDDDDADSDGGDDDNVDDDDDDVTYV